MFEPDWHQGVIGIVASRLKERFHRPVVAFARGADGEIKGSGRAISALHLRDALDLVAKREPDLILRFGGHAAAAGLTLRESEFARFRAAFEAVVQTLLTPADLARVIETDGALPPEHCTLEAARVLEREVWGQGFPAPTFDDEFAVARQRVVGERHLKLRLAKGRPRSRSHAVLARRTPLPARIRVCLPARRQRMERRANPAAHHRTLAGGFAVKAREMHRFGTSVLYNRAFFAGPPLASQNRRTVMRKRNNSTPSHGGCRISAGAMPSCGGIFDFEAKEQRLAEVVNARWKTRSSGTIPSARRNPRPRA